MQGDVVVMRGTLSVLRCGCSCGSRARRPAQSGTDLGQAFMLEFCGMGLQQDETVRMEGLAWSWGVSSGGRRGRGGWGGDEEGQAGDDAPLGINVQDLSCTLFLERNLVRGPMSSIMRGRPFSKFRLLGFSKARTAKARPEVVAVEGQDAPVDPRTDQELFEAGEIEYVPYFFIETVGSAYISSCSMGGSGGESAMTANISISCEDGYDFSYFNAGGRDAHINHVDEWASALLGATVTSHRPKTAVNAAATAGDAEGDAPAVATPAAAPVRAPVVEFGVVRWTPVAHSHWPAEFRASVRALLQCRKRVGGAFAALPRDVLHHIIAIVSREYVPSIERYANANPFSKIKWK